MRIEGRSFVNAGDFIGDNWPSFLPEVSVDVLERVWIEPIEVGGDDDSTLVSTHVFIDREVELNIPGVNAVSLVVLGAGGGTLIPISCQIQPDFLLQFTDMPLSLRINSDFIKPAKLKNEHGVDMVVADPDRSGIEVELGSISLDIDADGNMGFDAQAGIDLGLSVIGDTGIGIEINDARLYLNSSPPGKPDGWRGMYIPQASLYLPADLGRAGRFTVTDCYIGNGGFSGSIEVSWQQPLAFESGGLEFELESASINIVQNTLVESEIVGRVRLPFFAQMVPVIIGINLDGSFSVQLRSESGLITLSRDQVFTLTVDSFTLQRENEMFTVSISGQITPLIADNLPGFRVNDLSIDASGNVHIDGGWLDLPDQYSVDFHGFNIEVSKIGFGKTDDGGKWLGLSGSLQLVRGLPAGASVEGLRVTWYEDGRDRRVSLNGIGVEFSVPGAVSFAGSVAYRQLTRDGNPVHQFDGAVELSLPALDMTIDGKLVIGVAHTDQGSYNYFAVYVGTQLPAGIPLASSGLALYGIEGLFALRMIPKKGEDQQWYDWYKAPATGVTDLNRKWRNDSDGLGLGAGVTLGTLADNGYLFSGRYLFAIVFPGPVILIEGRANILQERAELSDDPLFQSLFVIDTVNRDVLAGLDVNYKRDNQGRLIEIGGGAKVYFDFDDASRWFIHLGQKEREKRIRAHIFKLFEANSYFMIDPGGVRFGSWVGYERKWNFRPLSVELAAWMDKNAGLSFKPPQLDGSLHLHGRAGLKVFGFGASLSLDALLAAEVFQPYYLHAAMKVGIKLPRFLPDYEAELKLSWGPRPEEPPYPLPVKDVALAHLKSSTTWPLVRGSTIKPIYDHDGYRTEPDQAPAVVSELPPPEGVPIVPVDCRPTISFGRSVHDEAFVGINLRDQRPEWELIGDPEKGQGPVKAKYALTRVCLDRYDHDLSQWITVAECSGRRESDDESRLYGSWANVIPVGGDAPQQTKLMLWSLTPFDYARRTERTWDDSFMQEFPAYPCIPPPEADSVCYDFSDVDDGASAPWSHPDDKYLIFVWKTPGLLTVVDFDQPVGGYERGAQFSGSPVSVTIELPVTMVPITRVKIAVCSLEGVSATAMTSDGQTIGPVYCGGNDQWLELSGDGLVRIDILSHYDLKLACVCIERGESAESELTRREMMEHHASELARWSGEGEVLLPDTDYRLCIETTVSTRGQGGYVGDFDNDYEQTEFAYFRTAGPPPSQFSVPVDHPQPDEFCSGLSDLHRYVEQTMPETVGSKNMKRPVFRSYDVGVQFNEPYVDLMYRVARKDLSLQLYDANDEPVRDAKGNLMVLENFWGETEEIILTESLEYALSVYDSATCIEIERDGFCWQNQLVASRPSLLLKPDCVYEARLIPALLSLDFTFDPEWQVVDEGTDGSSCWGIAGGKLRQASAIGSGSDPALPGTMLIGGDDSWTDYRVRVIMTAAMQGRIGVVFRYTDGNYYRFSVGPGGCDLVKITAGSATLLQAIEGGCEPGHDHEIVVEASGEQIKVYIDGRIVCSVHDHDHDHGKIGFYAWDNPHAVFEDVRVDDVSSSADVAYRFSFTTSRFANFYHHMHSYRDETWPLIVNQSFSLPEGSPSDAYVSAQEIQSSDDFAADLGLRRGQLHYVDISRLIRGDDDVGLLIDTPEPLDWDRIDVKVEKSNNVSGSELDGSIKLTEAVIGADRASDESVRLLIDDDADAAGHRVEYRTIGGPVHVNEGRHLLAEPDLVGRGGVLLTEDWQIEQFEKFGIGRWSMADGKVVCRSSRGDSLLVLDESWSGVRFSATVSADISAGIVFGYVDIRNYYRFLVSAKTAQVVRISGGRPEMLWQGDVSLANADCELMVESVGGKLLCWAGHRLCFVLDDVEGRWGLAAGVGHTQFANISVEQSGCKLWLDGTDSTDMHNIDGQVQLAVSDVQFDDMIIDGRFGTDDGSVGIVFGYVDEDNWHAITFSIGGALWKQVHCLDGKRSVVRQGKRRQSKSVQATVQSGKGRLCILCDGDELVDMNRDVEMGRVGIYRQRSKAPVGHLLAVDRNRRAGDWIVYDHGSDGPSQWKIGGGSLMQMSSIGSLQFTPVPIKPIPIKPVLIKHLSIRDRIQLVRGDLRNDIQLGDRFVPIRPVRPRFEPATYAVLGKCVWDDVKVSTRVSLPGGGVAVAVRFTDPDNCYLLSIAKRGAARLIRRQDGTATTLWQGEIEIDDVFDIELAVRSSNITGDVDGAKLFCVRDHGLSSGLVAVGCWDAGGVKFTDIQVTTPQLSDWELCRDRFAHGDTEQWSFVSSVFPGRPVLWSATDGWLHVRGAMGLVNGSLDDGVVVVRARWSGNDAVGVVFRYRDEDNYYLWTLSGNGRRLVKCSGGAMVELWADKGQLEMDRSYQLAVQMCGGDIYGYIDGVCVFAVNDDEHGQGQIGVFSGGRVNASFADVRVYGPGGLNDRWLVQEQFETDQGQFMIGDESGDRSVWEIEGNGIVQTGDCDQSCLIVSGTNADEYRGQVILSADGGMVGVSFGYVDRDNYYRFYLDSDTRWVLDQKKDGNWSELYRGLRRYEDGRQYVVTIDCVDGKCSGYVDGVAMFEREMTASGMSGLVCGNGRARFSEMLVMSPVWARYYEINDSLRGVTTMQIHSGDDDGDADGVATGAGIVTFPDAVHMRVVNDCEAGHERVFWPDSEYRTVEFGLVRNTDGRRVFVLCNDTQPADYRLTFRYKRRVDGLPVLYEAGSSEDEVVVIDVPGKVSG